MARAPFNVLVYPYHRFEDEMKYVLLKRPEGWWQTIAGGGEDNETQEEAVRREAREEGGIEEDFPLLALSTVIPVPVAAFGQNNFWNGDLYVVPKYCFGALLQRTTLSISSEHTEDQWFWFAH